MSTDVITTAIIGIAALIILSTLIAALLPQIFEAARSITSVGGDANDRIRTSAIVVNHDLPGAGLLKFDVLNNGKNGIGPSQINMTATYLNNDTAPDNLLPREASESSPYWYYTITGDADGSWDPNDVLDVYVVSPASGFASGEYQFRMLLNNGAVVQYRFTI